MGLRGRTYHEGSLRFVWFQTTIWSTPLPSPADLLTLPDGGRLENGTELFKSRPRPAAAEGRWAALGIP